MMERETEAVKNWFLIENVIEFLLIALEHVELLIVELFFSTTKKKKKKRGKKNRNRMSYRLESRHIV